MKHIKKIISIGLIMVLVLAMAPTALAASTGVSVNRSSVAVGQAVTVTITFSGGIAAVQFNVNYSASTLRYESSSSSADLTVNASNGVVTSAVMTANGANASAITCSFTFTGINSGSASINVLVKDCIDEEGNPVACSDGSASVTILSGSTSSKPQSSTQSSAPPVSEPPVELEPLEVMVDGKIKHVVRSLDGIELPDEFETAEDEFGGEMIAVARSINQDILLMYLTDADGQNGAFYRYVRSENAFYPFLWIVVNASRYTIVPIPADMSIPKGWEPTTLEYNNQVISAFQTADEAYHGFALIYASNDHGQEGFYLYDTMEGTIQRYVLTGGYAPITNPDGIMLGNPNGNFFERLLTDRAIFVAMCVAWALVVLIAGAWLVFHFARKQAHVSDKQRKKKEEKITKKLEKRAKKAAKKNIIDPQKLEIGSLDEEIAAEIPEHEAENMETDAEITEDETEKDTVESTESETESEITE